VQADQNCRYLGAGTATVVTEPEATLDSNRLKKSFL
jgi:hypothetical protein